MQEISVYNLLIVGRSGSGKSATTKLLTGNSEITVANSLKQVTKQIHFYEGKVLSFNDKSVRFQILDIPGLDQISNRSYIRQQILMQLESKNINLHGIIYVSSLTERDTIDMRKLFWFLEQLPWSQQLKKQATIPILTKYDNLVIDSHEIQIEQTKQQFKQIFQKEKLAQAWSKRIYWVNKTKSLEFKIRSYEQIRQVYEKQIERLVEILNKNRIILNSQSIRQNINKQQKYVLNNLFTKINQNQICFSKESKKHQLTLKVLVQKKQMEQGVTAISLSSIGFMILRVCQKQIPITLSVLWIGVPLTIALFNFMKPHTVYDGKQIHQQNSGSRILRTYENICKGINLQLQKQWLLMNKILQFKADKKYLYCIIDTKINFKFIDITQLFLKINNQMFQKINSNSNPQNFIGILYRYQIPTFQQSTLWNPQITVNYSLKKFSEKILLEQIQLIRRQYYLKVL